jgi:hypothetical protein
MLKGSDLLVAALEREGVDRIFGVPGEENLDTVESLRTSSIELVITQDLLGLSLTEACLVPAQPRGEKKAPAGSGAHKCSPRWI